MIDQKFKSALKVGRHIWLILFLSLLLLYIASVLPQPAGLTSPHLSRAATQDSASYVLQANGLTTEKTIK